MQFSCVKDKNFDAPESNCTEALTANATYSEIKNLYVDQTLQIQEDLIIEGYVVSSDEAGNFFSVLHIQDKKVNPIEGFQIEIDKRDSHLFYPLGSKIYIKLKGLYLGRSRGVFKLGATFTSFGNVSVGRLPASVVDQHIFVSCESGVSLQPAEISILDLREDLTNTLVQFNSLEIIDEELGETFALENEETERTLTDCNDNEILLLNSGFSDFQKEFLPEGNGTVTGVLLRENDNYFLAVRSLADIDFTQERCEDLVDEFTSTNIFISELADPENNPGARFVELFNSNSDVLSLKGWKLHRYTNNNTEISSTIDFSGYAITANGTLVISPNAEEFEKVYDFVPDLVVGTNSPADSNGDDNFELVDPFGTVIDVFGVIGEDGTGTNHEFENGRALRNLNILAGNSNYTSDEWTIDRPLEAPDDFTPGIRN